MKRILNRVEAVEYVGSRANLERLIGAGWVTPICGKQKHKEFDLKQLELALDRLILEGGWDAVKAVA